MAASSSLSTFLDVTQAARRERDDVISSAGADPALPIRAQVLAAVRDGARTAKDVAERTSLATDETLATLAWLSQNQLVELNESDGEITAQLTEYARKALEGQQD
jgi:predicted Rossmann fold nucleotide-binding protein DprA/Smf involved in DNA uptake